MLTFALLHHNFTCKVPQSFRIQSLQPYSFSVMVLFYPKDPDDKEEDLHLSTNSQQPVP